MPLTLVPRSDAESVRFRRARRERIRKIALDRLKELSVQVEAASEASNAQLVGDLLAKMDEAAETLKAVGQFPL